MNEVASDILLGVIGIVSGSLVVVYLIFKYNQARRSILTSAGLGDEPRKKAHGQGREELGVKSPRQRVIEILSRDENLIFITCLGRSGQHRRSAYGLLLVCILTLVIGIYLLYIAMSSVTTRATMDWHLFMLESIPRIGMIVLLIYIVQVLLRLYRYHLKMSDFYSSRYDAMLLAERIKGKEVIDAEIYSKALAMLSPPYDVGREVKGPWEDAFTKAKAVKDLTKPLE
ncbi:MAG: hypothetical protein KA175_07035 [Flavobacteriales bacterium]|nr:hypothetical protein [Flavobacteriales bacterium]MBP6697354.1 hypothetical protein [Flavobacteriales bacterium]